MNKITTTQPQQETPEPKVGQIWEDHTTGAFYLLVKARSEYALVNVGNGLVYHLPWEEDIDDVFGKDRKDFRLASFPITITPNLPDNE